MPSEDCCSIAFAQDLAYWEISETSLETCCLKRFSELKDHLDWTLNKSRSGWSSPVSHWSSSDITALSLVESLTVMKYFHSDATPALFTP